MKKIKFVLIIILFISLRVSGQNTPDFFLNKEQSSILKEYGNYDFIVTRNEEDFTINVYEKNKQYALKFLFDENKKISCVVFATNNHEIAQFYLESNDSIYKSHIFVEDQIQWTDKKTVTVFFKFQEQNNYPYQYTYVRYEK